MRRALCRGGGLHPAGPASPEGAVLLTAVRTGAGAGGPVGGCGRSLLRLCPPVPSERVPRWTLRPLEHSGKSVTFGPPRPTNPAALCGLVRVGHVAAEAALLTCGSRHPPQPRSPLLPVPLAPPCCPRPALSSAGTETRPATRDTALSRVPVPGGPFSALRVLEAPCPPHRVARVPTPVQLPSSQGRAGGPPCVPTGDHLCCSRPRPHCVSARRFMWPVLPDAVACLCHPGWAHARHPHARTNPWATLRSQCSALSRKKSPVGPDCTSRESWLPGWGGRRGPAGGTSPWTQRDPGQCVRGRLPARSRETRREKEPASPG